MYIHTGCLILISSSKYLEKYGRTMFPMKVEQFRGEHILVMFFFLREGIKKI